MRKIKKKFVEFCENFILDNIFAFYKIIKVKFSGKEFFYRLF